MNDDNRLKMRARIEAGAAIVTGLLFILTLITREWIEALTGWDPDHGNGSVEWALVIVLLVVTAGLTLQARSDFRKLQAQPA